MAKNPVMLRLKELEALDTIARQGRAADGPHGTGGLLNDIVKLRED